MQMTADTNVLSGFHVFVIVSAAILLLCSLCGYSVYLLYMRRARLTRPGFSTSSTPTSLSAS